MNDFGVLTRKDEVAGLVGMEYGLPVKAETIIARLDSRSWRKLHGRISWPALICNFTVSDGRKIKLLAYRQRLPKPEIYTPRYTPFEIDFAHDVSNGSWWKIEIRMTKTGRSSWYSAEEVPAPDNKQHLDETSKC